MTKNERDWASFGTRVGVATMATRKRPRERRRTPQIVIINRHSRPRASHLERRITELLGRWVYAGLKVAGRATVKIAGVALVGGLTNLIVHSVTDNHALNAAAMVLATGAAAAVKTR